MATNSRRGVSMPKFKMKKPKVKKLEGNFFEQGDPGIMADMRDSIAKIIGRDPYMNDSDIMETEVRH